MQSRSLIETEQFAQKFIADLKPFTARATVICLSGDLGSGKTTFTQSVAKALGVIENVTSPTFVIEKIYELGRQGVAFGDLKATPWRRLIHIDCYRLENSSEMSKLGWSEIIADPKNLIIIEWPEKIADILPADMIKIDFAFIDENTREINLHG